MQVVAAAMNLVGGITGALAIGLVIWKGGALQRQVEVNTGRLERLELRGSPALEAHERMDASEQADQNRRLTNVEKLSDVVSDLRVSLSSANVKLDQLQDQVRQLHLAFEAARIRGETPPPPRGGPPRSPPSPAGAP